MDDDYTEVVLAALQCSVGLISDGNEALALDLLATLYQRIAQDAAASAEVAGLVAGLRQPSEPVWAKWCGHAGDSIH